MKPKQLVHKLADMDKKAEAIDKLAREIRLGINDLFWELKQNSDAENAYNSHE